MVGVGDLFGEGSIAQQFLIWNVLSELASPILAPAIQAIASEVWHVDPNVPVPPDILAGMVARGLIDQAAAVDESSKSGMGSDQFAKLLKAAQHGPDITEAIELWRRGVIGEGAPGDQGATFYAAMEDSGIRPDWIAHLATLKVNKPTGAAALNALLQGQITKERALALWLQAGEDPDWFQDAFNSNGTAPTPDMAGTMANRRIIPWTGTGPDAVTFEQAFLEGPWRDKWEPAMKQLMEYLPPARTVVAMLHAGAIDDTTALDLLEKEGLSQDMAAAYIAEAHHTAATSDKTLAKSEVVALYKAHKITNAQAVKLLGDLQYSPANAALILSLADIAKADTHLTAAISKVHTLYTSHKINRGAAVDALTELKIAAAQQADLLALWDLEVGINVKQLTPAQIEAAWMAKILTEAEALTELEHLGYTPFDAWVLMSTKNGKPLAGKPAQGPGPGMNP